MTAPTAREVLAAAAQPWKQGVLSRSAALPPALARPISAVVRGEAGGQLALLSALTELLTENDQEQVQRLAQVLFPGFAHTAARTVQALLTRHPYPQGYTRRAFRAPGHPLQAASAAAWVLQTWALTREYPHDLHWFAVHAGLLPAWSSQRLGLLLAQALDDGYSDGDEDVMTVLQGTAGTQHEVARMGRHVPVALLSSSRPDAWALAEGLLLAAQRQEGLRQVILESVDEAHPQAFARMLRLILKEDLLRFAATLRAADVWFGLGYDVTDVKTVRPLLERAAGYLDDPDAAWAELDGGTAQDAHLALYTLAMTDAQHAATGARRLLTHPDAAHRLTAALFLEASEMMTEGDAAALLADADVRVGAVAVRRYRSAPAGSGLTFDALLAYALRLDTAARQDVLLFPWLGHVPARAEVLDLLPGRLDGQPLDRLTPLVGQMSVYGKVAVLRLMAGYGKTTPLDAAARELLMTLLQDRLSEVAQEAVKLAGTLSLQPQEHAVVIGLLKRKGADLRRGLIRLLAAAPETAQANAEALLHSRVTEQRQAGLQLLLEVQGTLPDGFEPNNAAETQLSAQFLNARLRTPAGALTLDNGLGLFDPAALAAVPTLQPMSVDFAAELRRGAELLRTLDAALHRERETPIVQRLYDGEETVLLGNVDLRYHPGEPLPLAEVWQHWWGHRPDAQPGDLTRMRWALEHRAAAAQQAVQEEEWDDFEDPTDPGEETAGEERPEAQAKQQAALQMQTLREQTLHRMFGPLVPLQLEYVRNIWAVLSFLDDQIAGQEAEERAQSTLALDAWETALSLLPTDAHIIEDPDYTWRRTDPRGLLSWLQPRRRLDMWDRAQQQRYWALSVYADRAFAALPRQRPDTALLLLAEEAGWASRHDLMDALIGPRPDEGYHSRTFHELGVYTRRKLPEDAPSTGAWRQAVDDVRARVLEVELDRGDLETPASRAALSLSSVPGAFPMLRALALLGRAPLRRGYIGSNESRDTTFSHLIRVSLPAPEDTPETFAAQVRALKLPDSRLLDLAMFAPQWARLVDNRLGWPGLQDAVYWLHAHTRDTSWSVPQEVRQEWAAEISERTPLTPAALVQGAVDVAWFRRVHAQLGPERFAALLGAARYASSSGGHKRAELFARAILGQEREDDLNARILDKRHQDAVRALGLLPLSRKAATAAREVEARYRRLAEFRRSARQFGAQRQVSERLAADIGMQNLARTAGYPDPQRLMWAMEARLAPDWTQTVDEGGVRVQVTVNEGGEAALVVRRGEKFLKALPAALKKHAGVLELRAAVNELNATRSRMRAALEDAMVRGDHFQGAELTALSQHPVIAPMLRGLLWVLAEGPVGWWQGDTLNTPDGPASVGDAALRLAHPHDLYRGGQWSAFQTQVMARGLTQPFKQVFREYYPLTAAEQGARRSTRFGGHFVQPSQAAALLKTRGWVTVPEEGVRKTYHAEGLSAWVDSALGYGTPAEVEGTPLHALYFVRTGEWEALPLDSVPPRLLSESLRDLDLVVSVAHVGGVDPEASASTVQMREALLRETLRLLHLGNVRLQDQHALIAGHYAQYTVHLGSGTVHRQPGGGLCIIPVHNQAQGRVFLPFADPDPRTAEVVSKVLLLAQDREIQDPTILEQLA